MAKYRMQTAHTRWKPVEGGAPERLDYPPGSVLEPTNAEYQAFHDVLEPVEDATPLTLPPAADPRTDPQAPYVPPPEAPAPPARMERGEETPPEGETPTVPRRR